MSVVYVAGYFRDTPDRRAAATATEHAAAATATSR